MLERNHTDIHKLIIQDKKKKTRTCSKPDALLITLYALLRKQINDPVSQIYYLLNRIFCYSIRYLIS